MSRRFLWCIGVGLALVAPACGNDAGGTRLDREATGRPLLVAVDADPAIGIHPLTDPEDAYALSLALQSPACRVLGIAINYANASLVGLGLPEAVDSAEQLLAAAGSLEVPLYPGARSAEDLGIETEAVRFLLQAAEDHPHQVNVISVGSLTATATAMMLDPGWIHRIRSLVIMGGSLDPAVFRVEPLCGLPITVGVEYNVSSDIAAAQVVFAQATELTLITLEFSSQVLFTPEHQERLGSAGTPLTDFLLDGTNLFQQVLTWALGGFMLYDSLAVGYLLWPELYSDVETTPIQVRTDGRTLRGGTGPLIRVPHLVYADAFTDRFIREVSRKNGKGALWRPVHTGFPCLPTPCLAANRAWQPELPSVRKRSRLAQSKTL